jgi:large subunit ribosomal protein L10
LTYQSFLVQCSGVDQRQQAFVSPAEVELYSDYTRSLSGIIVHLKRMAISKDKKQSIVASFKDMLTGAASVAFVQFKHLTVKDATELRRALRAEGVAYKVGKKTLLKRVLSDLGITGELPMLDGEIAVAASTDLLAPARGVYEFQKTHKDKISLVGGVFEGAYMDQQAMVAIASIPPREVLLSQLAYLLASPMQRLAIAVNEVAKQKS